MADEVAPELSAWADSWAADLSEAEHSALRMWQVTSWCEVIQAYLGSPASSGRWDVRTAELIDLIDAALARGRLPEDTVVFRGEPSSDAIFGVPAERLEELVGAELALPGFLATSLSQAIALRFVEPIGPGGPVLLAVRVPAGSLAAPLGLVSGDTVGELEVLLPARSRILIGDVIRADGDAVPTVVAEVM